MDNETKARILAACTRMDKATKLARIHQMIAAEKAPSYMERTEQREIRRTTWQRVRKVWRGDVAAPGSDPRNDVRGMLQGMTL